MRVRVRVRVREGRKGESERAVMDDVKILQDIFFPSAYKAHGWERGERERGEREERERGGRLD